MLISRRTAIGGLMATAALRPAFAAAEPMTYLFPAPAFLPAFIPFQLAQKRNYFGANNLAVTFETGRGGADVAKQVGVGNASLGGGVGETSMIVRPNDLPVRAVALLGQKPLFQLVTRKAAKVEKIADLHGKKLGVIGYQDTGYYALLAVLAASGIKRTDLEIQAVGTGRRHATDDRAIARRHHGGARVGRRDRDRRRSARLFPDRQDLPGDGSGHPGVG